ESKARRDRRSRLETAVDSTKGMKSTVRSPAAVVRAAFAGALLVAGAMWCVRLAAASERAPLPQPSLNGAVARPHLEAPAVPQPAGIALPNPASSHLLLSDKELQIPPHTRLMVFAPHPDDETLAAGGLIQHVVAKQGTVRVVFLTNGDGYPD